MGNDKKNRDQKPKSLIRANVNGKKKSWPKHENINQGQRETKNSRSRAKISCKNRFLRWPGALFRISIRATPRVWKLLYPRLGEGWGIFNCTFWERFLYAFSRGVKALFERFRPSWVLEFDEKISLPALTLHCVALSCYKCKKII